MPLPPRSPKKGAKVVRRTLADGTVKTYRYPRKVGRVAPKPADSTAELIEAYQRSPEWVALAKVTKSHYNIYLVPLHEAGHLSAKAWTRRDILTLRDAIASARGNGAA